MDKIKIEKEAIVLDEKEKRRLKEVLICASGDIGSDDVFEDGGKILPFVKYLLEEL